MIAFLSSNLLMLPELPSVSRARERRRFARYEGSADRAGHCSKELNRWIGRWENEGGAIGPERSRREFASPDFASERENFHQLRMRKPL